MKARPTGSIDHGVTHIEAMKEDIGGRERDLWELEHDADLEDEIDAFAAVFALFLRGEAVKDRGRTEELLFGEEPLGFGE